MNILVVGAGQIGSRHVQGLAAIPRVRCVTVVDPSPESRQRTAERWRDVPGHTDKNLVLLEELPASGDFSAAILSTNATARLDLLRQAAALGIRRFLAEKLLFQSEAQWGVALGLAETKNLAVFPNYVYRYARPWAEVREALRGRTFSMEVSAGDIGLTTNLPHWLDLFEFLGGSPLHSLDVEKIGAVYPSKRGQGLIECSGALSGTEASGSRVHIDFSAGTAAPSCTIRAGSDWIRIDENNAAIEGTLATPDMRMEAPMVSRITSLAIPDILDDRTLLPSLAATAKMNRLLLRVLGPALGFRDGPDQTIPIT
ncbi:Gfo/Idh/MocA family protein [Oleispirillum naphthae]|uniref:Gfo/Idh/MocA family protein n=1 Tax=Oleispirillum naphthae TaxID=2838853 RepID=UPI003082668E